MLSPRYRLKSIIELIGPYAKHDTLSIQILNKLPTTNEFVQKNMTMFAMFARVKTLVREFEYSNVGQFVSCVKYSFVIKHELDRVCGCLYRLSTID